MNIYVCQALLGVQQWTNLRDRAEEINQSRGLAGQRGQIYLDESDKEAEDKLFLWDKIEEATA